MATNKYKCVALCGFRQDGKELYKKLREDGIKVCYIMERNYQSLSLVEKENAECPIVGFDESVDFYKSADAILISQDLPVDVIKECLALANIELPLVTYEEVVNGALDV